MKKTLLSLSLALAMTPAAWAADVTVYGVVDVGLSYVHSDSDIAGQKSVNKFTMENAQEFGSRWGIRGVEKLDNGLTVGFTLESGFESDTGKLDVKQGGRLFGREASLSVGGSFGTVWAGRLPIFGSTLSANGLFRAIDPLFANYTEGFGSGFATASMWTRVDNALAYRTPTFGGFTGYAMYSFQNDSSKGVEGKSSADRYGSLAVQYKQGALEAILVADTTNWGNEKDKPATEDDGYTVTIGGNYTFDGGFKVIAFAQYFDNQSLIVGRAGVVRAGLLDITSGNGYGFVDGWGASIGAHYPIGGGVAKFAVNYRDMDNKDNVDFTRWTVAGAYDYPLSKRTAVYAMAGYSQEKIKAADKSGTPNGYQIRCGVVHRF